VPTHQVKEFAPRLSFGCSISTKPYLALGLLDHPRHLDQVVNDSHHAANYYAMITGAGFGTVRLLPRFHDPLVRYQLAPADRRDLADGVRKLAEMLFAAGADAVYPGVSGFPPIYSPDQLSRIPNVLPQGRGNLMTIHLFSSCPMGEDRTKCAADSFGRVHGFQNLFIADASLLCTAPGVNPQGSIMAVARRNALHFLANSTSSLRS
jgi:choline dehydrogenase-like flavoprotein